MTKTPDARKDDAGGDRDDRGDRPQRPFREVDGPPRLRTVLTAAGPVEYRTGEAIVALRRLDGGQDVQRALRTVSERIGVKLESNDDDLRLARRSGYLRVRFAWRTDVVDLIARADKELGRGVLTINTVMRIGQITADPMRFASGFGADPMRFASAYGADPMRFANSSTARPAAAPGARPTRRTRGPGVPTVAILDTGVPVGDPIEHEVVFDGYRDVPDLNTDRYLDIAAGHSTFIRTIVERACPAATIISEGVVRNDGDADEADISAALYRVYDRVKDHDRLIVNLSFSGYYDDDAEPPMVAAAVRELVSAGAVVVAAAGNNGTCRRKYPAAMPEVVSVGAVGPCGPAPFSNHGHWVDASAPGVDLVSVFFAGFDGAFEPIEGSSLPDIDDFAGWAMWSGTSFSTPAVVGALAEIVETHDCDAVSAADLLLRRSGLYRVPDYGVIVNRIF